MTIGFGSTKLIKFAASGKLNTLLQKAQLGRRAAAALGGARGGLRRLLLRIDPSLADDSSDAEDVAALSWRDLRGPRRKKRRGPKPPKNPFRRETE